jgi:hypothetical protein
LHELYAAHLFSEAIIIEDNKMKKTISPIYIVLASALYFFIASIVLDQVPGLEKLPDIKLFQYSPLEKYSNATAIYDSKYVLNSEKNKPGFISNR